MLQPAQPSPCLDGLEGLSFIEGMSLVGDGLSDEF
jgi:hypothetical protein